MALLFEEKSKLGIYQLAIAKGKTSELIHNTEVLIIIISTNYFFEKLYYLADGRAR